VSPPGVGWTCDGGRWVTAGVPVKSHRPLPVLDLVDPLRHTGASEVVRVMDICSDLITSAALLDYIRNFDLDYVIIEMPPC